MMVCTAAMTISYSISSVAIFEVEINTKDLFSNFLYRAEQKISISFWLKPFSSTGYVEIIVTD